ncbi:MAG: metallophosphoesterase [Pseudomonadota bacterium]
MPKIIVLSDLHLMNPADPDRDLGNHQRLETAISRINDVYADTDLVVFAGDLADRGKYLEPYHDVKDALTRLVPPYALTIGNHDSRESFQAVFGQAHCDDNGFVQSAHNLDGTHVIVLDSMCERPPPDGFRGARSPEGEFCEGRLAWLRHRLNEAKGRPTIIILHHPPLQLQITSDRMALQNPEPFVDMLVAHGDIRQVISGHIHMTTTAILRKVPFTTVAGSFSTTAEDFGLREGKRRHEGPAQMAVVFSDETQTTVHFDNYVDAHPLVTGR